MPASISYKGTTFSGIPLDPNARLQRSGDTFTTATGVSVGMWVKIMGTGFESFAGSQTIFVLRSSGAVTNCVIVNLNTSHQVILGVDGTDHNSGVALTTGTWYFIALSVGAVNAALTINGVLAAQTATTAQALDNGILIGTRATSGLDPNTLDARMCGFIMYTREVPTSEWLTQQSTGLAPVVTTSIFSYLRMLAAASAGTDTSGASHAFTPSGAIQDEADEPVFASGMIPFVQARVAWWEAGEAMPRMRGPPGIAAVLAIAAATQVPFVRSARAFEDAPLAPAARPGIASILATTAPAFPPAVARPPVPAWLELVAPAIARPGVAVILAPDAPPIGGRRAVSTAWTEAPTASFAARMAAILATASADPPPLASPRASTRDPDQAPALTRLPIAAIATQPAVTSAAPFTRVAAAAADADLPTRPRPGIAAVIGVAPTADAPPLSARRSSIDEVTASLIAPRVALAAILAQPPSAPPPGRARPVADLWLQCDAAALRIPSIATVLASAPPDQAPLLGWRAATWPDAQASPSGTRPIAAILAPAAPLPPPPRTIGGWADVPAPARQCLPALVAITAADGPPPRGRVFSAAFDVAQDQPARRATVAAILAPAPPPPDNPPPRPPGLVVWQNYEAPSPARRQIGTAALFAPSATIPRAALGAGPTSAIGPRGSTHIDR